MAHREITEILPYHVNRVCQRLGWFMDNWSQTVSAYQVKISHDGLGGLKAYIAIDTQMRSLTVDPGAGPTLVLRRALVDELKEELPKREDLDRTELEAFLEAISRSDSRLPNVPAAAQQPAAVIIQAQRDVNVGGDVVGSNKTTSTEFGGNLPASTELDIEVQIWIADPGYFRSQVVEWLDAQRQPIVRRGIQAVPGLFFRQIPGGTNKADRMPADAQRTQLLRLLDNLTAVGSAVMQYRYADLFSDVQRALYVICRQAERTDFPKDSLQALNKFWVWQEVLTRVYALGALLIEQEQWALAKALIQQEVEWDSEYRTSYWSRYVLVMVARAGGLPKGWIAPVVAYIKSRTWLTTPFIADEDAIVSAVCQFDYLQCFFVAAINSGQVDRAFPSFWLYQKQRTEPIITKLVVPGELRNTVTSLDDAALARIVHDLDTYASGQFGYVPVWEQMEWSDQRIVQFLKSNLG